MRVENSLKNIATGLVGQLITYILSFIVRTVFILTLGKTYLGVNGLFTNVLNVLSFAELGIGTAIVYNLYKPLADNDWEKIKAYVNFYKKAYIRIGLIVLLIGAAFTPFLPYIIKEKVTIPNITLIYLLFVLNSAIGYFFSYKFTIVTASQKGYILTVAGYFFNILSSVLQLIILLTLKNYILVLCIQVIMSFAQNWYFSYKATKLYPQLNDLKDAKLNKEELKQIYQNVKALVIYRIGGILVSSTDNIIIAMFVGVAFVGLYSNYLLLIAAVVTLLSIIFNSLTASIGNLNATEGNEKKYFIFKVVNFANFWLYGFSSIFILVTTSPFIKVWIGNDFVMPWDVVFIIAMNVYLEGMLGALWVYRETMGLFVHGRYRPLITAAINLIFSVVLVRKFGIVGVFIGTTIARVSTNVWFDPYIVFKHGFKLPVKGYYISYLKNLVIFLGTGSLVIVIVNKFFIYSGLLNVIGIGITSIAIPNIIFFIIFRKTKEFQYLFNILKLGLNNIKR